MVAACLSLDAKDAAAKAKTEMAVVVQSSRDRRDPGGLELEQELIVVVMWKHCSIKKLTHA